MNELHRRIAEYIRLNLYVRHIPHTEMGRRLGWTQSRISRRLNGDTPFTIDELDAVVRAADIDYLAMLDTIEAQRRADRAGFGAAAVLDRAQHGLAEEYERRAGTPDEGGQHDASLTQDDGQALG